jgi:membrane fusion protein, multidrug efflux system
MTTEIRTSKFALTLLLTLGVVACGGGDDEGGATAEAAAEQPADGAIVLSEGDVAVVTTSSVGAGAVVTGPLEPWRIVEVRAQVPGVVSNLAVDRGDAVGQGTAMARIEAEGIRGMAASARAQVAAAEANLALANRQLESARRLHQAGAMSDIEMQQAQTAYQAAQAQLSAAEAGALGAAESASRATVTSPISGEVSARMVSEGEAVNPGQPLFTVVNTSQLELKGSVPVNVAARIRAGMPVEFAIDAYPGRVFSGRVARVEPTADPSTRQVGVYVRLANPGGAIVGGVFAVGRILTGEQTTTAVVPVAALRDADTAPHVFAIRDGRAVRVGVQTGARNEAEGMVEIVSGLNAGETVIVAPGVLQDGAVVRIPVVTGTIEPVETATNE